MSINVKKTLQIGSLVLFFFIIIGYAFFGSQNLIFGVKIKNVNFGSSPASPDGMKVADSVLHITGNAKNANSLRLDGREISIDENGDFTETIALLAGYNIINLRAQDKFGYVDEKNYKIIYEKQI